jgi:hypothetical protein
VSESQLIFFINKSGTKMRMLEKVKEKNKENDVYLQNIAGINDYPTKKS